MLLYKLSPPEERRGHYWRMQLVPEKKEISVFGEIVYQAQERLWWSFKDLFTKLTFESLAMALYLALPSFHPPMASETLWWF